MRQASQFCVLLLMRVNYETLPDRLNTVLRKLSNFFLAMREMSGSVKLPQCSDDQSIQILLNPQVSWGMGVSVLKPRTWKEVD